MILRRLCIGFLFIAGTAFAREPDGTLGLIQTPNNGVPVIAVAGDSFETVTQGRAKLRLAGLIQSYPLETTWTDLPGGYARGISQLPADLPVGRYALEAVSGDKTDRNERAVFIRDRFPEYYIFAHLSDVHIGKTRNAPRDPETAFRAVLEAVNASEAAFALITGDLTENGEEDQYRRFIEGLDACTLPTYVCAGNHDRKGTNYARFFGPLTYHFRFGRDGYLVFDTKDFVTADELGPQDGLLHRYRRELKPCRWTIGASHRYEAMMGMRAQLILFVDDPIDYLFFGHWHRENTPDQIIVPWGQTRVSVVPAAINGVYRLIDVTASGIITRAVTRAGAVPEENS